MPFVSYNCPTNTDSQNNEKIFIKKSLSKLVLHFTVGAREKNVLLRNSSLSFSNILSEKLNSVPVFSMMQHIGNILMVAVSA